MQLIFVRHADPDYSVDSLTPTGFREAEALRERMEKIFSDGDFVSPLGRARKTAEIALQNTGRSAKVTDWLQEFNLPVQRPRQEPQYDGDCVWDWYPVDLASRPNFYDKDKWTEEAELKDVHVREEYDRVCGELDRFLEERGYQREGLNYRVKQANHHTYVFYCHFGIECVLLSHLVNVSPMILWHGFCSAPSGVTTVFTEEREAGLASWRITSFGDTSHLYIKGMETSFHARFCECYQDESRH